MRVTSSLPVFVALAIFGCALEPGGHGGRSDVRVVRVLPHHPPAPPLREATRRSLLYFGHMTDLHVTDEMSPLRIELVDAAPAANWAYNAAWRPQEAMSAQTLDRMVRSMNLRITSTVPAGDGTHAEMAFALVTGDLIDNLQQNEMRMAVEVLGGGNVDPFSGKFVGPTEPCAGASQADLQRMNQGIAARRYSGVQRYSQYPPDVPADRRVTFYDPAQTPPPSKLPKFPRYSLASYPGLLDRAQHPFEAEGLAVPYFVARGNHGTLAQGIYAPYVLEELYQLQARELGAIGCRKPFPTMHLDPYAHPFEAGSIDPARQKEIIAAMQSMYGAAGAGDRRVFDFVSPDSSRELVTSPSYPSWFSKAREQAGYANVDPTERRASKGYAHYYAFTPKAGLRFISLDTNASSGGPNGNLNDPQFRWLMRELAALAPDTLAVVFGHHSLETLDNPMSDDCPPETPTCSGDPRTSKPVHLGCPAVNGKMDCTARYDAEGHPDNLRDLLLATPNVILLVNGHTHANGIDPFATGSRSGFWQVTSASVVDWPQQTRTLELMDNRDGTLSVFGTLVDLVGDAELPPVGKPATDYSGTELHAVARTLAAGDTEWREGPGHAAAGRFVHGTNIDGNVELVVPDPRAVR